MYFGGDVPRWFSVRNDGLAEIPAGAVVRVTGAIVVEEAVILTVEKPNDTSTHMILFNGPLDIPGRMQASADDIEYSYGEATAGPSPVLYDDAETPEANQHWGFEPGSWKLVKGQPGAIVLGDPVDGRVLAVCTSIASYGGMSGGGELTIVDGDWTKVPMTGEHVEPFGLESSVEASCFTVHRYATYHVEFCASVYSKTIGVDSPDNAQPEFALFRDGQRAHQLIATQNRLRKSPARECSFTCLVVAAGGHTLDVRVRNQANEIQRITLGNTFVGVPTGGAFVLDLDGETTGPIAFNASAADVQVALEALANIEPGDVTCSGGGLPATPVDVEFTGTLANANVPQMTATSSLTPGGSFVTIVTFQGPDNLVFEQVTFTVSSVSGFAEELPTTTTTSTEPTTQAPTTTTTGEPTTTTTNPPTTSTTQGPTTTTTTGEPTTTTTSTTTTTEPPTTTTTMPPTTTTSAPP